MYTSPNFRTKKILKEAVKRYLQVEQVNAGRKKFYQDGRDFYDEQSGTRVATYPTLVASDSDLEGAEKARHEFLKTNPQYRTVLYEENNAGPVTVFAPGLGSPPHNGSCCVEGPHSPAPHTWYATVEIKDGIVVGVK